MLMIRGGSFAGSMSAYLIEQLDNAPNVSVLLRTGIAEVHGERQLEALCWQVWRMERRGPSMPTRSLSSWAANRVQIGYPTMLRGDRWGYVVTGRDLMEDGELAGRWPLERSPSLLETSMPGVFAVGDVRHRSIKRVAAAVGEGSTAILLVHEYLDHL